MRVDQYRVTVKIDGRDTGVWRECTGGDVDSTETVVHDGGMAPPTPMGGRSNVTNVTVSRVHYLDRDNSLRKSLLSRVGKAAVVVTKQPLDQDGNAAGRSDVYTGILKMITNPTHDAEGDGAATWSIEVTCRGNIG